MAFLTYASPGFIGTKSMDSSGQDVGRGSQEAGGWRCFRCGEFFAPDQATAAAIHFGTSESDRQACRLAPGTEGLVTLVRNQQAEIERLRDEEGPNHRDFYSLGYEHAAKLRKAEESGYGTALDDVLAAKVEPDLARRIIEVLSPLTTKAGAGPSDEFDPARMAAAAFDSIGKSDFGEAVRRAMWRIRDSDLERSARLQRAATAAFASIRSDAENASTWLRGLFDPGMNMPGEKPRAAGGSEADTHKRVCLEASSLSSGGWLVTSRSHPGFTHHVPASVGLAAGMAEALTALEAFVSVQA